MITGILLFMAGSFFGIVIMCLAQVAGRDEK